MKLVCLYYGPAELIHPETKVPIKLEIPSGPGTTAGFERVKIVAFADDWIGVYCIVSDDFDFESVDVKETSEFLW